MKAGAASTAGILLLARGPQDVFEAASKRAARRMRNAAIRDTADFDADGRLCVTLRWRGKQTWQVRRGGQWVDVCVSQADADED